MPQDVVEVIVACHDPHRPLERTMRSALDQRRPLEALGAELRLTVVCHNRPIPEIAEGLSSQVRDAVGFLHLADGIYSPAGPINLGIRSSTATWLTTVGSDDTLAEGALAGWLVRGRAVDADAVIPPIIVPRGVVRTPLMRPGRRDVLHPVADHLAYRTAPLGLLRTRSLHRIDFGYTEAGLIAGSDIEAGLRLWFRGGRTTYAHGAPGYVVSEEMGSSRVTSTVGPVERETGWLPPLLEQRWLRSASLSERQEIATKLARTHLVNAVGRRARLVADDRRQLDGSSSDAVWTPADSAAIRDAVHGLETLTGGPLPGLSRAEASLLMDAAKVQDPTALAAVWSRFTTGPATDRVLPRRLRDLVRRDARPRLFLEQQIAARAGSFRAPTP